MDAKLAFVIALVVSVSLVKGAKIANETTSAEISCSDVRKEFVMKGIGPSLMVPDATKGDDLVLCPSPRTCCSKAMESKYEDQVKKDFKNMLQSSGSYLKTLIATSATKFKDTFLDMVQSSENSTTALFSDVYQLIEGRARLPLGQLFADMLAYMSGQDVDLEDRVRSFFDSLFPLAFHHSTINSQQQHQKEFAESYKDCLRDAQQELRPFGDLPDVIVLQVSHSFEAARTFLEALQVGVEVLNTTEHMDYGGECHAALVRISYCSRCQGLLDVKPCAGLCLNVIRGCLASVMELDSAWSEYVGAVERLTSGMVGTYNIEHVLSTLDTKISETIMYVMENTPEITKRVKQKCGHLRRVTRDVSSPTSPPLHHTSEHSSPTRSVSSSDISLYIQLQNFVHIVGESKNYYSSLSDDLCKVSSTQGNCWNGLQVAGYTKPVTGVGVAAQKYNPEFMFPPRERDAVVHTMIEKLQHVRQVMTTRIASVPQSDSSLIVEGSGSGSWWRSQPSSSDDEDYAQGSGSGDFAGKEDKTDIHFERTDGSAGSGNPTAASNKNQGSIVLGLFVFATLFKIHSHVSPIL